MTRAGRGDTVRAVATPGDSVLDYLRRGVRAARDGARELAQPGGVDAFTERLADRLRVLEERINSGQHVLNPDHQRNVALWYARLELSPGATPDEVRLRFRDLMRRYHPDRHAGDAEAEALANRISQDLTVAYEGLMRHLGG